MMKYVKRAFLLPWNLMIFGGAAIGAALSPAPDAFLALVAAAELVYLGGLVSIPKFRSAVDAEEYREGGAKNPTAAASPSLTAMVHTLPPDAQYRFTRLHGRCREMRALAAEMQAGRAGVVTPGSEMRTASLDQLLWGFLRLLRHQHALRRLLDTMNEGDIGARLDEVKHGLAAAQASGDERLVKSFQERLATAEQRLEYFRRTNKDLQFVAAELDRIEDKIQALSEMAVNQRDPDSLSAEIDAAAASMQQTEAAISELQDVTGVSEDVMNAPPIMDAELPVAERGRLRVR